MSLDIERTCCKCDNTVKPDGPINAFIRDLNNQKEYEDKIIDQSITLEEKEIDGMIMRYNSIIFRKRRKKKHIFHIKCKKCGEICEHEIEVEV